MRPSRDTFCIICLACISALRDRFRAILTSIMSYVFARSPGAPITRNTLPPPPDCSSQAAGGLISASLLATPGASKIFLGGLTAYQLDFRSQFVGWTAEDTANYRGPTIDIVSKLASNTRTKLKSTWTVSESGTAGPTGGDTPNRTPGYVAVAVAGPDGVKGHELNTGTGEREANMVKFAVEALKFLQEQIEQKKASKV